MEPAKLELMDGTEAERVVRWRVAALRHAGDDRQSAMLLAAARDVDVREASALAAPGCRSTTAFRILL